MEINYDLIIKYLVTNKIQFSSKKHMIIYSDLFPEKFKNILQNKFYRYGVNQNNSFYNTILTLLNKHFITYNNDEEIIEINKFKNSLVNVLNNFNLPNYLSTIIDKKTVFNKINEQHIQVISEILSINFIIFNFKDELINIIYTGNTCNPYKPTLLISNYDEFYEPIIYETDNKKIFSYNDIIIKKLYNIDIGIFPSLNKNFKLNNILSEILNDFNVNNIVIQNNDNTVIQNNDNTVIQNNNNTVIQNNNNTIFTKEETQYTHAKLNKMVKKDLEKILDNKNINYSSKMLKKNLIDLILE